MSRLPLWLVSLKDKETLGEQCIRFCVVEGYERYAQGVGRRACELLASDKTAPRARVVPIVEPITLGHWYKTSRFRGSVGNFDETVKEDHAAVWSQVTAKIERTLRETGFDVTPGAYGVLITRLADLFLSLVR